MHLDRIMYMCGFYLRNRNKGIKRDDRVQWIYIFTDLRNYHGVYKNTVDGHEWYLVISIYHKYYKMFFFEWKCLAKSRIKFNSNIFLCNWRQVRVGSGYGLVVSGNKSLPEPLSLQWRHNEHDRVSNNQPHHCLLNRLFGRRSKKTSKLRVTGLCVGNSPMTGEFPAQMASNAENVSIWWRHHVGRIMRAIWHH